MSEFRTAVSVVEPGRVLIRGYSQAEIIGKLPYADATFLTIFGRLPSASEARLTDAMLTSLLDHGWVAATGTAARYIASGNPQFIPAVAGGILAAGQNTLSPEHSFKLIEEVIAFQATSALSMNQAARAVVAEMLKAKQRIPGLGHPVHRSGDFRSTVLFDLADELGLSGESVKVYRELRTATFEISGRDLPINIDACLACLGRDLGWSANQVIAIAVLAVLPGLMAHVIEEIDARVPLRYIRDGEYVGAVYRPLDTM